MNYFYQFFFYFFAGTYKKLTAASRSLGHASPPVLANFLLIGRFYPLLTLLWAQYLTQLVSIDLKTWSSLTGQYFVGHKLLSFDILRYL